MKRTLIAEWEGREYDYNPKSADWYWALGIIATASAIATLLFGNYLFAIVIIIAASSVALHAAKYPPLHHFKLTDQGIFVGSHLHPFSEMTSFSVLEDIEGKHAPMLSIKTDHWLSPHMVIPLEGVDVDMVYNYFVQHTDEHEHHHSFTDVVAALLGF